MLDQKRIGWGPTLLDDVVRVVIVFGLVMLFEI